MSHGAVMETPGKGLPLHIKVLIGFVGGLLVGLAVHYLAPGAGWVGTSITYFAQPIGQIFLNLLFMMVLPLMMCALILGVAELGDIASLGRLGLKTLLYTALVTATAVLIGLLVVNLIQPGAGIDGQALLASLSASEDAKKASDIAATGSNLSLMQLLLGIVPKNIAAAMADDKQKLGVMFFALMIGIGLVLNQTPATQRFKETLQGLFEITMRLIAMFIRLAPYAVFALMYALSAKLGFDPLLSLLKFALTVILALAIHMFIVLPLWVNYMGGMSPRTFFRGGEEAILTAFATASSTATLPITLRVAEQNLKLPQKVARFTLTIGASANHHGTALFEGVTVLFLAQAFGVNLDIGQQLMVLGLCILGGIGTAGVPAGSLPVIAMILTIIGVPPEGLAIILGVDRFLDMCRTSLNVTGDLATAVVVSNKTRSEEAEAIPEAMTTGHGH